MGNSRVNQKSLPERTADALADMLHRENLRPGERLPQENELAERFEVSRQTMHKAEQLLAKKGVLRVERGVGTFVAAPRVESDDPLGLSLIYDKQALTRYLLEVRLMIEPRTAALAAQNASRAEKALLMDILAEMGALIAAGQGYAGKDMEFHQAIANAAGNPVIHNLIPYIHQMIALHDSARREKQGAASLREHERVARAIRDGRGMDAYDAMQAHLMNIYRQIADKPE